MPIVAGEIAQHLDGQCSLPRSGQHHRRVDRLGDNLEPFETGEAGLGQNHCVDAT